MFMLESFNSKRFFPYIFFFFFFFFFFFPFSKKNIYLFASTSFQSSYPASPALQGLIISFQSHPWFAGFDFDSLTNRTVSTFIRVFAYVRALRLYDM